MDNTILMGNKFEGLKDANCCNYSKVTIIKTVELAKGYANINETEQRARNRSR